MGGNEQEDRAGSFDAGQKEIFAPAASELPRKESEQAEESCLTRIAVRRRGYRLSRASRIYQLRSSFAFHRFSDLETHCPFDPHQSGGRSFLHFDIVK
jgi:hypothetical protein